MEMGRNTLGSPPWAPLSLRNEGSPTSSPGCHRRVPTRLKELHVSGRDRHFTATRSIIHHPAAPITARHTHACLSLGRVQIASFRSGPLSDFSSWWGGGVCSQDRMLRPLQGDQPTSTTSRGSPRSTWPTRPSFCTLHVGADSTAKVVSRSASCRAAGQRPRPAPPSEPHCECVPRAATPPPSP